MSDDLVKQARDAADLSRVGWTGDGWVELREDFVRALADRLEALERMHERQIAYSSDLQRIIEDLCSGRAIRAPETTARFHYDMAVASTDKARREALEEAAKVVERAEIHKPMRDILADRIRALMEKE